MGAVSTASYLSLVGSGNLDWIEARFERAVDIIQSLPKSGPIQTSYHDKLLLYSYIIPSYARSTLPADPLTGLGCTSKVSAIVQPFIRRAYPRIDAATEGNIKVARPGLLDVLGRAKWSDSPSIVATRSPLTVSYSQGRLEQEEGSERVRSQTHLRRLPHQRTSSHHPPHDSR